MPDVVFSVQMSDFRKGVYYELVLLMASRAVLHESVMVAWRLLTVMRSRELFFVCLRVQYTIESSYPA